MYSDHPIPDHQPTIGHLRQLLVVGHQEEGDAALAGKAVGKDRDAGKQTFVSLFGVDRAREQARMLVAQAKAHLHDHGPRAGLLCAIADYIIERDR